MPRGSEELTNARRNEIIDACAQLYETMSFKDITIKEIGKVTSFTRTSIYNYFQTKEEIFLALLQREYNEWSADLLKLRDGHAELSANDFAAGIAGTLEKRAQMLKILSMNHYDMEENSRPDNLIEFKRSYLAAMEAVRECVEKFFPDMSGSEVEEFIYAFFPFLFGIYPYTFVTEKQFDAMKAAGFDYPEMTIYEITYKCVKKLLK